MDEEDVDDGQLRLPRATNAARAAILRRLTLIQRLSRGPASRQQLIRYVRNELGELAYGDASQALRRDLNVLRDDFDCLIEQDSKTGLFQLKGLGLLGLIALEPAELETFAQLRALYPSVRDEREFVDATLPLDTRVSHLLERLLLNMSESTRARIDRVEPRLRVVGTWARARPDLELLLRPLERFCRRSRISFEYRSLHTIDQPAVRHEVSPYEIFFRDGQYYLDAFMERNSLQPLVRNLWTEYRVDRIVPGSLRDLHRPVLPRPERTSHEVIYWLDARVAGRNDFTVMIDPDQTQIKRHDDGSVTVTVQTTMDLFLVRQLLLRYAERCRVLAPPQLVQDMRDAVRAMARHYSMPAQDNS